MTRNAAPDPSARGPHVRLALLPALAIGILALAGCGSSSKSESTASTSQAPATSSTATGTSTSGSTATGTSTSGSTATGTSASGSTATGTSTSGSASSGSAGRAVSLSANQGGQLEYDTKTLSASAGKVSVDFTNDSPIGHNVTIESSSGETVGSTPTFTGGSKTLSVNLKPGTYKFFCSVPGHRQAGMEGTLTVK